MLPGPIKIDLFPGDEYRGARDRLEQRWGIAVPRRLGDDVAAALCRQGLV